MKKKNPGGRPPKELDKLKSTTVRMRVTREQSDAINQAAEILNIDGSKFMRGAVLSKAKFVSENTVFQEECAKSIDIDSLSTVLCDGSNLEFALFECISRSIRYNISIDLFFEISSNSDEKRLSMLQEIVDRYNLRISVNEVTPL